VYATWARADPSCSAVHSPSIQCGETLLSLLVVSETSSPARSWAHRQHCVSYVSYLRIGSSAVSYVSYLK
jgi:hypothetical protein